MADKVNDNSSLESVGEIIEANASQLSTAEVRVASHLMDFPEMWAFEPASRLAKSMAVHRSTVVRFAQRLGFSGFPDLQKAVRAEYLRGLSREQESLLVVAGQHDVDEVDILDRIFAREAQNLDRTYRGLDRGLMRKVAESLANADRIAVLGRRFSFPIAHHLSFALRTMRGGVQLAPEPGGSILDAVFDLGARDLAVVISMRRTSPAVKRALRFLGDAGVPTVFLTDAGPVRDAPTEAIVLRAHTGGTSILDSYTALTSVAHALLSMTSQQLPSAPARLEALEEASVLLARSDPRK